MVVAAAEREGMRNTIIKQEPIYLRVLQRLPLFDGLMNFAIVMGSEKAGVSTAILKKADYRVKIPMLNEFDSLNVANAASIVIYESVKQLIQKSENDV